MWRIIVYILHRRNFYAFAVSVLPLACCHIIIVIIIIVIIIISCCCFRFLCIIFLILCA